MTQLGDRITVNGVEYVTATAANELQCQNDIQAKHLSEAHQTIIRLYGETANLTHKLFSETEKAKKLIAAINKHKAEASLLDQSSDLELWEILDAIDVSRVWPAKAKAD